MPPPKKPKKGPTSADQFLSAEELTKLHRQRVPSSASESSDTVSGRNSSPPSNTDDQIVSEDTETISDNFNQRTSEDVPMNLSSSFEVPSNGNSTNGGYARSSVVFSTNNQDILSGIIKGESGTVYSDPEPPVLQRITDTASPPELSANRYSSPTRVATASPNMARRLQTPPLSLPRHQSPMLTLMMAVPTSHNIWQPSLGIHEALASQHTSHFSSLALTSLDNKVLPQQYSQPHDFSKKLSNRSEGSGRKRKPRYSLLSAALSGSATTISTSETREQHRKHTIDLLSSPMPTAAALLRLSSVPPSDLLHCPTNRVPTLTEHHLNAAIHSNTSIYQQTSDLHRVGDASQTSQSNNTSNSHYTRTTQSGLQPFPRVSNSSRVSVEVSGNGNGLEIKGLSLLHMSATNNGVSLPPPSARLMMGGLVAAVSAQPLQNIRGEERLSAPSPESPVFTGPKLPTDTTMSINTRVSTEMMTSTHTGSTSSSQSFPLDETRDGCISETIRRDSSRDGEEDIGVSPMQSPISSTSISGPPPTSTLPTVCSSSCVIPDDRSHMNGSASSIDMDGGASSLHGMDPNFGDPIKIKQEEQLPGSSSGSGVSRQCQVCNDGASGFHYGVWSCEGCKAFFKRSIQGPVDYICPATNNCTIDKHRRKSCQACRLRKCYEVGMTKGTSQRKERRSSSTSIAGNVSRSRKRPRPDNAIVTNGTKAKRMGHLAVMVLDALIQADTPILESFHDHSLPPSKTHLLSSLLKLVDRELVYLINWAKHVQGYTDLVLCDQVHLIECCWMELLLLSCAFRSIEYQGKQLVFASDLILDRQVWHMLDMVDVLEQVAAISAQMALYGVHKEELLLLKALSLTNAEVRQLSNPGLLSSMRNNLIDALTATAQKHHPQNWGYVPSLMLLLAHVRQASLQTIGHLQKLKSEGVVPFCDLLKEMLEAQSLPSEEKSALNQCG